MGRGIGHHDGRKRIAVGLGLLLQIGDIDIAVIIAFHDHDLHACHRSRCRIGAMRRLRDQAHIAVAFAARLVVAGNRHQAGELALRSGVRLQRYGRIAGTVGEHLLETGDHLGIALCLIVWCIGVNPREFRPGHRDHLGGGVQLHGAGSQRDHTAVERQVAVGEAAHVPQHLGLGTVAVEHRLAHETALAGQR